MVLLVLSVCLGHLPELSRFYYNLFHTWKSLKNHKKIIKTKPRVLINLEATFSANQYDFLRYFLTSLLIFLCLFLQNEVFMFFFFFAVTGMYLWLWCEGLLLYLFGVCVMRNSPAKVLSSLFENLKIHLLFHMKRTEL